MQKIHEYISFIAFYAKTRFSFFFLSQNASEVRAEILFLFRSILGLTKNHI